MQCKCCFIFTIAAISAHLVMAQEASDESRTIEKIKPLGGMVENDDAQPSGPAVGVSFAECFPFNDKFMRLLKGMKQLSKLNLSSTQITDGDFPRQYTNYRCQSDAFEKTEESEVPHPRPDSDHGCWTAEFESTRDS